LLSFLRIFDKNLRDWGEEIDCQEVLCLIDSLGLKVTDNNLAEIGKVAKKLPEPESYCSGKDWSDLLLPHNVLCFLKTGTSSHPEVPHLVATAKRYEQHPKFQLLVILKGESRVGVETNHWELATGDSVLIFPHQAHYFSYFSKDFQGLCITFELSSEFWKVIEGLRNAPRRLSAEVVANLLSFTQSWLQSSDAPSAIGFSCQLSQILQEHTSQEELVPVGCENDLARAVKDLVYKDLSQDLSVAALSSKIGVSGSYLRERFRESEGVSLGHFVRSVRLIEATKLLREGPFSVRDVACRCGFGSFTAFSRAFNNVYGTSPSGYRRLGS